MADDSGDILLRIRTDLGDTVKKLESVEREVAGLRKTLGPRLGDTLFDSLEKELVEAREDLAKATAEANKTGASLEEMGKAADQAAAAAKRVRVLEQAVRSLAEVSSKGADSLRGLSEETARAAIAGSEGAQKIAAGLSAFNAALAKSGEGVRAADEALEVFGERDVSQILAKTNNEAERTAVLFAQVAKSLRDVEKASGQGLGSFAEASGRAEAKLEELRLETQRLGSNATPELRAELKRLEAQFEETYRTGTARVIATEKATERAAQATRQLAIEQKLQAGQALQLTDLVPARILRFAGLAAAVAAGFKVGYEGAKALDEASAGFFDRQLAREETLRDEFLRQKALRQELINLGVEFVDTEKGVETASKRIASILKEAKTDLASLRGFSVKELGDEILFLNTALGFQADEIARDEEALKRFSERLVEAEEMAGRLGDTLNIHLRESLRKTREEFDALAASAVRGFGTAEREVEGLQKQIDGFVFLLRGIVDGSSAASRAMRDTLIRTIDELREKQLKLASEAREGLSAFSESFGSLDVTRAIASIRELEAEVTGLAKTGLRDLGKVSRESADQMIAAIDDALKKIQQLDPVTREQAELQRLKLTALREEFYKLGSDYQKSQIDALNKVVEAQKEAAKKRLEIERNLVASIKDLLGQLADAVNPEDDSADLKRRLEDKRSEIVALEAQQEAVGLTAEEVERLNDLQEEERRILAQIRKAAREATGDWRDGLDDVNEGQQRAKDLLRDLVTGNEAFRDGYRQLSLANQEAVRNIIESLGQAAEAGDLAQEDLAGAARQIREVFLRAGIDVKGFSSVLEGGAAKVGDLREALNELELEGSAAVGGVTEEIEGMKEELALLEGPPLENLREMAELLRLTALRANATQIGVAKMKDALEGVDPEGGGL